MAGMDFTPQDVKKTLLLDPGWYLFKVTKYQEKLSEKKGTLLHVFTLEGQAGPAKDVVLDRNFPASHIYMAIEFLNACGANIGEQGAKNIDPIKCVGKTIEVFIKHREYEGRTFNEPAQFRKPTGVAA